MYQLSNNYDLDRVRSSVSGDEDYLTVQETDEYGKLKYHWSQYNVSNGRFSTYICAEKIDNAVKAFFFWIVSAICSWSVISHSDKNGTNYYFVNKSSLNILNGLTIPCARNCLNAAGFDRANFVATSHLSPPSPAVMRQ